MNDDNTDNAARPVHIDIDVAEQLVQNSAKHAQGALSDTEFIERRERLLTGSADPDSDDSGAALLV